MKKKISYFGFPVVLFFALVITIQACKKDCKSSSCFDRKTMLTDISNQVILPAFQSFSDEAETLKTRAQTFCNTPNEANLQALQNQWKEVAYTIKEVELFKNGPINNGLLYPMIDFWPVRTNDVDNYFNNATSITAEELSTKGSTVKGSPVIEYLIFDKANGNPAVIGRFTSNINASKRRDYLIALTQNLSTIATQLNNEWKNTYVQTFISKDGTDLNSSANSLVNEILQLEDYVKGMKVGYPAGKKDGNLYPTNVEAYQSDESMNLIRKNIEVLYATFNGGTGQGFDDYLNFVGAKQNGQLLSEKINVQFAVCFTKCDAITMPLSEAVTQQAPQVTELYNELQKLLVFLKVDMVNNLGITITFNDNDGD